MTSQPGSTTTFTASSPLSSPDLDERQTLTATLDNGLQVILREDHDAPVASFWTWYRVGSRNELPGRTGLSHWVEHMQFKGTPSLAKGQVFRDVSRVGGVLNAFTSHDWTVYFETVPADRLDLSLRIEPDRMSNSLFDPDETESERTVILSERQGAENRPTYLLIEELYGAAYRAHPYRHMVLGYENDLRAISRDDLYSHYRRHYVPNNAVIVAVGDFDARELLSRIEETFGAIAAGPPPPAVLAREPAQLGERRVTLQRPAPTDYLYSAYHVPEATHPDTTPLMVLDAVLSGAKGMGFGGGGGMGRSSRLYRALVANGLARSAGSDAGLSLDPGLLMFGVTGLPGGDTGRVEATLDAELRRITEEIVPADEFTRVRKQLTAQFVYSASGVSSQAYWLGQMAMLGDYRRADSLIDEMRAVTPEDVRRVAETYLVPSQRTMGWLHPSQPGGGTGGSAEVPAAVIPVGARIAAWDDGDHGDEEGSAASQNTTEVASGSVASTGRRPFERLELPDGIVLLGQVRPSDPVVVAQIRIAAGSLAEADDRPGVATFTGRMLSRGQAGRDFAAFNELTDGLGASLSVDSGRLFVDVSIRCLRDDFPGLLDLAADVLRRPDFPEDEIERVRQELLAAIQESDQNTASVADLAMRQVLYPEGHPYARRQIGDADTIARIDRDDLIAFHAAHYGAATMTVAVVGGVVSLDSVAEMLAARFGGWSIGVSAPELPAPPIAPATTRREDRLVDGKSQTDLLIVAPTIERGHPDYYALETATLILGQLGLSGRLGAEVRDRRGLAYGVSSSISAGRESGLFVARAGVSPKDADQAIAAIGQEIRRLQSEDVEVAELEDAQSFMTGVLPIALERSAGVAANLLNIEYYDLGLDYLDRYPAIIQALTRTDLRRAAQSHLDPERLVIATAGPALPVASGETDR
jgi:zinc protease